MFSEIPRTTTFDEAVIAVHNLLPPSEFGRCQFMAAVGNHLLGTAFHPRLRAVDCVSATVSDDRTDELHAMRDRLEIDALSVNVQLET